MLLLKICQNTLTTLLHSTDNIPLQTQSIEAVSFFSHDSHLVGTTSVRIERRTLRTQLRENRSAPHSYPVECQHGNFSNNDLIRHLVGTLVSH